MDKKEKALELFGGSFNCSQSVFSAYSEKFNISEKDAKRISSGFGGGIGRTQSVCGALTGAVMLLGCRYFDENNIDESKKIVTNKTRELFEKFKGINNSVDCLNLTGVDFSKDGGHDLFLELNIHEKKCNGYIKDVCNILEELI